MTSAYLYLQDGTVLEGTSFGYAGETHGEVVFTTGMTGYPQSLTDPSFAGQILVFTYPLLGNYGVPRMQKSGTQVSANFESSRIWARGVVVSSVTENPSHYQSSRTFSDWLSSERIPGICGIDTRLLTRKIRDHGVMAGAILTRRPTRSYRIPDETGHVVSEVSIRKPVEYKPAHSNGKHIALIDCGVKHGIIRQFLQLGYRVTRLPWDANPLEVRGIDGVVCSNGPGDPKDCPQTIKHIAGVVNAGVPFVGICLGHQLLALAIGADTYKLPFGHRGLNQPCQDVTTGKAYVTSQNHGYAVHAKTIPKGYDEWFINLNDHTNEGLKHKKRPIWSTQFHPEGHPGPFDTSFVFTLI